MDWQMIRVSYLVFLNGALPNECSPWRENRIIRAAEIGVAGGLNAELMLKAYNKLHLTLVDPYDLGQSPDSMLQRVDPYKDRVSFIRQTSKDAAIGIPDEHFDYIYIDAAHDYDNVLQDMKTWYPKLKPDGMFAGHDWLSEGVRKAVITFLQDTPQRIYGVQRYFEDLAPTYLTEEENQAADWWFIKRLQERRVNG